jgi:hypothetical protein
MDRRSGQLERLNSSKTPSKLSFIIELVKIDKLQGGDGNLDLSTIEDPNALQNVRETFKDYLNTLGVLAGLFAFSTMNILAQTSPLQVQPAAPDQPSSNSTVEPESDSRRHLIAPQVVLLGLGVLFGVDDDCDMRSLVRDDLDRSLRRGSRLVSYG